MPAWLVAVFIIAGLLSWVAWLWFNAAMANRHGIEALSWTRGVAQDYRPPITWPGSAVPPQDSGANVRTELPSQSPTATNDVPRSGQ